MKKAIPFTLAGLLILNGFCYGIPRHSVAHAKYNVSPIAEGIKASTSVTVTGREIMKNEESLQVDLKIPVILGMNDNKIQEIINNRFEKEIMEFRGCIEKEAKEYAEDAKKYGWAIHPYIANTDYKVTYNENNLLSITVTYYQYTGGAHGNYEQKSYNINLESGYEVPTAQFFYSGENYKEVINQEIKKQISADENMYFDGEMGFKGISDDQPFYIEDGNIVVYFGLYEIAPYAAGIPEFKIPFSAFKYGVKLMEL